MQFQLRGKFLWTYQADNNMDIRKLKSENNKNTLITEEPERQPILCIHNFYKTELIGISLILAEIRRKDQRIA